MENVNLNGNSELNDNEIEGGNAMEKYCENCGVIIENVAGAIKSGDVYFCDDECARECGFTDCEHCGEWARKEDMIEIDGMFFCNSDCANDAGYVQCEHCGEWIKANEAIEIDNEYFCDEDCAYENGYRRCDECGEWVAEDDYFFIESEEIYVCEDCLNRYFTACSRCGDYHRDGDMERDIHGEPVCEDCIEWHYCRCEECGELIYSDEACYSEDDDAYYCESCFNELESAYNKVHGYSFKPCPEFYKTKNESGTFPLLYMGFEDEVDDGDDQHQLARDLYEVLGRHAYYKRDGSLGPDGVEIVTHPCTLEYYRNEFPIKEMCKVAVNNNYRSHDTTTCGLHVHVNRDFFGYTSETRELNIAKVILLINRFWDEYIFPFTRRDMDTITHWANKKAVKIYDDDNERTKARKTIEGVDGEGRYVAVNLQNDNTIELRIFRGTLKPNTLLATLEFVDTICRFAKTISINEIDRINWMDIFSATSEETYPELHEYLKARGIYSNEKAVTTIISKPVITSDYEIHKNTLSRGVRLGDTVVIRDLADLEMAFDEREEDWRGNETINMDGVHFTHQMREYCGHEFTVSRVMNLSKRFHLIDDNGEKLPFMFTIDMVNLKTESENA